MRPKSRPRRPKRPPRQGTRLTLRAPGPERPPGGPQAALTGFQEPSNRPPRGPQEAPHNLLTRRPRVLLLLPKIPGWLWGPR
eukprot:153475-Pyramimonas_sp.AAC.1